MSIEPQNREVNPLSLCDIPPISQEFRRILTLKSLHITAVGPFDPENAGEAIARQEGAHVTAFDLGGAKIAKQVFVVEKGLLVPISSVETQTGAKGDIYLDFLLNSKHTPFVGISCAGLINGTVLTDSPNAPIFTEQLRDKFGGDFARVFPTSSVALDNDAVAGSRAAGVEAFRKNPDVKNVLFVIDGHGFGFAILTKDYDQNTRGWHTFGSEPGHLIVPEDLNYFSRVEACGVFGARYTCIEKIIASGAGVEGTYRQITGERKNGREISALYQRGDELATKLYQVSAIALAQAIALEEAALRLKPAETTIVYHGGGFEVPYYANWVTSLLERYIGQPQRILKSKDFSEKAELTGAATAALMRA